MLVVALLIATAAAFAVTERLKLEDSPILRTKIDPVVSPVCTVCKPAAREAQIRFRLRKVDYLHIDIVDTHGTTVRDDLVSGRYQPAFLKFSWDGRGEGGRVVPDGLYRVRVSLEGKGKTLEFPNEIRVDATAPAIQEIDVGPVVFSPDGDERADQVNLRYRFTEGAYPVLYVDGTRLGPGFRKRPVGVMQWYALRNGRGLPPGEHRLALAAKDEAGNLSPSTREFTVRIRYIDLRQRRYVVRRNTRVSLRISTDATTVRYRLAPLRGGRAIEGTTRARRGVRRLVLRIPGRLGRYRLTVRENGHIARAVLLVRR